MGFKAFLGSTFNHSHENQAFNALHDTLRNDWQDKDEQLYLFGNFFVAGKEFDALIIKHNAIIVIDFKNFGGTLSFSENGHWQCGDVIVKGGNSRNPFLQIRNNKFALLDYVKSGYVNLLSKPNLGHIAGLTLFHQDIDFDEQQLPQQIRSWFHICDMQRALRTINGIASAAIDLSAKEMELLVEAFGTQEYFPDGRPSTKELASEQTSESSKPFSPIGSQKQAFRSIVDWVDSGQSALTLSGMVSTGKKTLLTETVKELQRLNKNFELIAPNARLAKKYTELGLGEFSSVYQWLYSSKSDGVITKSNGVELAVHPVSLTFEELADKVIIFVEAHLISNSYYDLDNSIFGSGHMVSDLLSVYGEEQPKLFIVGDPYQLSRGDTEQSLIFAQEIKAQELGVTEILLDQQIESEPIEISKFQFEVVQQMVQKQFNRLPQKFEGNVVSKVDGNQQVGQELSHGRFNAVYLTALNETAQKVNHSVKQRFLNHQNPNTLTVGDLIDFHNSTPEQVENQLAVDINPKWIHSGEIAEVTKVYDHVEAIEFSLKGRNAPTYIRIGELECRIPSVGEFKIKYLVDYLQSDKPELTQDQILTLNIVAKQQAESQLGYLKDELKALKDAKSKDYSSKKKQYDDSVRAIIANSPLLNAARIRFAYAMTVHRAQGRTWDKVYLDAFRSPSGEAITNDAYFRFIYTASTCTESKLGLLRYPNLTPLHQTQFIPNQNLKIADFQVKKGFHFDVVDAAKLEGFDFPNGFESDIIELKSLCFSICNRLNESEWKVLGVKQNSYQELYTFAHSSGQTCRVRFHYDKSVTVTNMVFLDEKVNQSLCNGLKQKLDSSPKLSSTRLNIALDSLEHFFLEKNFNVVSAKQRSEWEVMVGVRNETETIELKAWVDKKGLITKIMPEKASSEALVEQVKGFINE
ncbi:NERD domain-containing protein [Shewanella sp. 202IG2-18]|uniref:NERD domain-containing protein/DEAD/DEAH box helicase n=1 Tax=Parashewanella hymeniacidonis TaxID=2807618 RepID=UPI00195F3930|nr:NERD domain-containing protein [Parashewanella hymeniacidonis]MBM7070662.1 NERD domain-containing protein [Parashewanella hymeniacidonis]